MGQSESAFKRSYAETVSKLSTVQLGEIASRFNELYARAGGPKGHLVDREAFSKYFKLPVTVGDRLFDAFDEKKVRDSLCQWVPSGSSAATVQWFRHSWWTAVDCLVLYCRTLSSSAVVPTSVV